MRYPKPIQKGNTIAVPAPSFGCTIEPYRSLMNNAVVKLEKAGFSVITAPNCHKCDGIGISSSPESCGKELTDFYCSPENDALISASGGELMCESIEHVDFDRVRNAEPKWFMGYSDNTYFTFLLNTLCDVASIYACCFPDLGTEPYHPACVDAIDALCGKREAHNYPFWELRPKEGETDLLATYNCTEPYQQFVTGGNAFEGRFLGGCIDVLMLICGTKFDRVREFNERYAKDGVVWFLESCDMNPMDLRRALWELRNAGWFETAKGFLIGRPMRIEEDDLMGATWENAVLSQLGDLGVPIVRNVDIGHLKPTMPILSGAYGKVKADGQQLDIQFLER